MEMIKCKNCGGGETAINPCYCDGVCDPAQEHPSALIDGLSGVWSKDLPTEQAWYWWWNEDPDSEPVPVSIITSGTDGRCFASKGQLGWTRHQYVEEMGGQWMRLIEPVLPAC